MPASNPIVLAKRGDTKKVFTAKERCQIRFLQGSLGLTAISTIIFGPLAFYYFAVWPADILPAEQRGSEITPHYVLGWTTVAAAATTFLCVLLVLIQSPSYLPKQHL